MSVLGRNIGDIYFGFVQGVQYLDTDVLVTGEAAADVVRSSTATGKPFGSSGCPHPQRLPKAYRRG